jgi:hypothetical protein
LDRFTKAINASQSIPNIHYSLLITAGILLREKGLRSHGINEASKISTSLRPV